MVNQGTKKEFFEGNFLKADVKHNSWGDLWISRMDLTSIKT
ncbi:unnamed protein product [marine sediment metagenome]|uniref:Uncharacterized protein n=1 Tax=marine sediment metagenome TaxID=412755 RepID=X1SEQ3_9ZZZZ